MTDPLSDWSATYPQAARALWALLTPEGRAVTGAQGSEARVQSLIQLEAPTKDFWLGRNNSGSLLDQRGVPVRFGLGNTSAAVNKVMKSGDLIGWKSITITPEDVGSVFARFASVEVKKPGGRIDPAQVAWAALVTKRGGLGLIVDREGMLP